MTASTKSLLVALVAAGLAALPVGAAAAEVPALAVVETSGELAPLSLLVQAGLSEKGLVLVERAQLDAILREQALSAAGLAQPDALVKVGALVRADGFVLITLEEKGPPEPPAPPGIPGVPVAPEAPEPPKGELVRIRLTETAHGVRLLEWFVAWDAEKAEEAATEVVAKVTEVAPKLKLPAGRVIPIGIVDVHRVQLEERHQWACRAFRTMLSARLGKEPRIVVLEREDLRRMLDEKLFTSEQDAEFWRSGVLIEGYMQRSGKEGIELKLQCKRAGGQELALAPLAVDLEKLGEAVERSAEGIVQQVTSGPPAASWEPAKEAEEFFRQGMLLKQHGRYDVARPILDTASALSPANLDYAVALLDVAVTVAMGPTLDPYAYPEASPDRLYSDEQVADLVARVVPMVRKATNEPAGQADDNTMTVWWLWHYFNSQSSVATESIREGNRQSRKAAAEMCARTLSTGAASVPANTVLPAAVLTEASTPAEGLRNLKEAIRRVVMPQAQGGRAASNSVRAQACCDLLRGFELGLPQHLADWDNTLAAGLLAYLEELSDSKDPVTRFFGAIALVRCSYALQGLWPSGARDWKQRAAWQERTNALFARFGSDRLVGFADNASEAFLKDLGGGRDLDVVAKRSMIAELLEAMSGHSVAYPPEKRVVASEVIYGDLIGRGDVDSLVWLQSAFDPFTLPADAESYNASPEVVARALRLLERTGVALQATADTAEAAKALRNTRRAANRVRDDLAQRIQQLQSQAESADKEGFPRNAEALRASIGQLRESFPELRRRSPPAWLSVKMLLRTEDWPRPWDFSYTTWRCVAPDSERPTVWIASSFRGPGDAEMRVALAGLEVPQGSVVALWQSAVKRDHYCAGDLGRTPAAVTGERKSYVAVEGLGLVELPGSATSGKGFIDAPRILGPGNALPPACVTGIAPHGDRLWVAYAHNGSGLGIYDPEAEEWGTVLSSEVRTDRPFEDGAAYELRDLTPFEDGLAFLAHVPGYEGGASPPGAWRLDMATGNAEPLFGRHPLDRAWRERASLWVAGQDILARLLPEASKAEIALESRERAAGIRWWEESAWTVEEDPFVPVHEQSKVPFSMYQFGGLDLSTAAVHGDEVWARYGRSQIIVLHRGKGFDEATIMDNDILEGGKVLQFFETPYGLIAVGEGSVGLIEEAGQ